ncbi:methyl-accepting chemotaxis protein [Inhella gelatinilytica]|nr:methyl-accepting chemotaxis protein [Inhella gelatinilytica]
MFFARFLGRLPLKTKFAAMAVISAVLVLIPSTRQLSAEWQQYRQAERADQGIDPASALLKWMQLTQQHRGLSGAFLQGQSNVQGARAEKERAVTAAAAAAQQSVLALAAPELTTSAHAVADTWAQLAGAVAQQQLQTRESYLRHTALVADQQALLDAISLNQGLNADARPVVQGLQQAVLNQLPRGVEVLGQLRAGGTAALAKGSPSAEERARFEVQLAQARQLLTQNRKGLALALAHGGPALDPLRTPIDKAEAAAGAAFELVESQLIRPQDTLLTAQDFFAQITRLMNDQYELIDAGLGALRSQVHDNAVQAQQQALMFLAALATLGSIAMVVMGTVAAQTTRALGAAAGLAEAVAQGDLRRTVAAETQDEMGRLLEALNRMSLHLGDVVAGVRQNADSVATAAIQIAQGNQDLSNRTEQQASALQQTAASMEQLGTTVRQNADHAQNANALAHTATEVAQRGGAVMAEVVSTMQGISDSSRRIADIIGVIDGIAFQTNILALNAAVEAARAGEQGRGFAVVAAEVRLLAQRSAQAAKEIKGLIEASTTRVEHGTTLVTRAGGTVQDVVRAIQDLSALMAQISTATNEQSSGVHQVGQAVTELDRTTQQNAALVEQSAAAADSLQQQARQLAGAVAVFQTR